MMGTVDIFLLSYFYYAPDFSDETDVERDWVNSEAQGTAQIWC